MALLSLGGSAGRRAEKKKRKAIRWNSQVDVNRWQRHDTGGKVGSSVVSVFRFRGLRISVHWWKQMVPGINGWPHWSVITSCYHASGMKTGKERRKDLRTFARYTIKFTIDRNAIGPDINCRPPGSVAVDR